MAIRIRCQDCRKKVSIDEAFAGGVCRCPYCTATVPVPGDASKSAVAVVPAERPEEPSQAAPPPEETLAAVAAEQEHIPVARPVKVQGIVTIVLLGLVLLMIAASVLVGVKYLGRDRTGIQDLEQQRQQIGEPETDDGSPGVPPAAKVPANPFIPKPGMVIGDVGVISPVIYCIDAGHSMAQTYDFAVVMAQVSVNSLTGQHEFNIVICREGENLTMPVGYHRGGAAGRNEAEKFLDSIAGATGASDLAGGVFKALDAKPKMIVLFARKSLDEAGQRIAAEAKATGVVIVTVAIDAGPAAQASLAKLAEKTGGKSAAFSFFRLQQLHQEAPPLY